MAVNSRWWTKETVAVVTGANKGIGFEIVRQFAENDLTVILTARDANRGLSAVKTLHDQGFDNVVFRELDVQKRNSISDFGRWMKDNYGGLDILVNNAAIYGMMRDYEAMMQALQVSGVYDHIFNNPIFAKAHKTSYELSKNCIEINYYGTKRITEELLPLLRPEGRIVNVSSEAGLLRVNNAAIYGMMRDYEAMMQALRVSGVYDHIFNNPVFAKAHKTSYELSKNCIEINYYGTKRITEELLPLLRPEGRIVNVSSEAGLLRFLKNDSLRRQLSDVSNITEEFIDNMVETFLEDIKKGEVEGKG
ncbi:(+)-neomenthol dehydrogenase-like isoform X1 [Cryptomeria japonica]|uniref:(+)-neomenthol dehydrogenase-like isoform X1 n=1 Tax=Cryptomeria japonica TaxID=3369 RepID=UPI0027DA5FD2|nr:(+)-neomenthol dehydrogenase-like isoform X1 [Cryptomeria japonica]